MPDELVVVDPEETLYQASRCWARAAGEWEAAAEWLRAAVLPGDPFGSAYEAPAAGYARAYHDCLWDLRAHLLAGAERLHRVAGNLRTCAQEYAEIDADLTARVDRLLDAALATPRGPAHRWPEPSGSAG